MPPASAHLKLATNVQCLIDYYLTAGYHNTNLFDFISKGCLKKTQAGEIEFDLGSTIHQEILRNCCRLCGKKQAVAKLGIFEGNRGFDELCRGRSETNPVVLLAQDGQTVSAYEEEQQPQQLQTQQPQPPQIQQPQQPTLQELMPTPSPYAAQPISHWVV
ncbi:Hypothetical predicted protein [Mytilus galloprovincialis]|uniref:Uncharacterized protein n=1 Tax=Mytilus galloprovincialis TaxID=29158 RepID=A0A8B6DHS9_MYTGA|nr:Hypothetical predicted protein [Mytilus galloprovincialis]